MLTEITILICWDSISKSPATATKMETLQNSSVSLTCEMLVNLCNGHASAEF